MTTKQQFIEKILDRVSRIIHKHNRKLEVEKFGITVKEEAELIRTVKNGLSECWDMAGEKIKEKLQSYLIPRQEVDRTLPDYKLGYVNGENNIISIHNAELQDIINSLTSQKEGKDK